MRVVDAIRCDPVAIVTIGLVLCATACTAFDSDPPPFTLSVSPASVSTAAGGRTSTSVIANRSTGVPFPIWVYDNTPPGIHSNLSTSIGRASSQVTAEYFVDDSVVPGPYDIEVQAYAIEQPLGTKAVIRRAIFTINVTPYPGKFQLARIVPPVWPDVPRGQNTSIELVIARTAPFSGPVHVSTATSVRGVVVTLDPSTIPATGVSSRLTVSAANDAPLGALSVAVQMTGSDVPSVVFYLIFKVVP